MMIYYLWFIIWEPKIGFLTNNKPNTSNINSKGATQAACRGSIPWWQHSKKPKAQARGRKHTIFDILETNHNKNEALG